MYQQPDTAEQQDALDQLIIDELGQQARWRGLMQDWEEQQRRRRRRRILPVLSNIASVAALMILGFILQTLIPRTNLADRIPADPVYPHIEQWVTPADSAASGHNTASEQRP